MVSKKTQKLWQRAQNTKANWKARELLTLYEGFGFTIREGSGSHKFIRHSVYTELTQTINVHPSAELSKAYIKDAVDLIKELLEKEEADKDKDTEDE